MNRFEQLVDKLRSSQSREMIISPASSPRFLNSSGWTVLDEATISPAQSQQLCLSLLTPEEKDKLGQAGKVSGSVFSKKGYSVSYEIQSTWAGYTGYFQVASTDDLSMDSLGVPEVLKQSVDRKSGIILVTGPRRSGKTTVLAGLMKQLNQASALVVTTFSDHPLFLRSSEKSTLIHVPMSSLKYQEEILERSQMADVLIIDSVRDAQGIEVCFQAAEQGKLVLVSYESMSLIMAMKRIISSFKPEMRSMAQDLFAHHLHLAVGQRLAPSEDKGQWSLASELLVNTPAVSDLICKGHWEDLPEIMKTKGEKTGMHTLNQSLLQMLLRRRISLQTAYELSPEVEELHLMMEKVGV